MVLQALPACVGDGNAPCTPNPCPGTIRTDSDWTGGTSDTSAGFLRYEKFAGVTGQVCDLHFWGLSLYKDGTEWSECVENPMTFTVSFYADNAGQPGTSVQSYTNLQHTGNAVCDIGDDVYEYFAVLSPCLDPGTSGASWVSVEGTGGANCRFLWLSSATGDASSCVWDGTSITCGAPDNNYDMSMCVTGTGSCP